MGRNDDAYQAVITALKLGYRHVDTADMYGNEYGVGKAVRDSGLKREEVFVTTKIPGGTTDPAASIEKSLKNFDLGYVDLWLIHSPHGGKETRLKLWKTLLQAKAQGRAHDIGVSNYGIKHLKEIREAGLEAPAVNQIELHPFCTQEPIVKYCNEHGIVVSAFCPLVRGDFSDPVLQEVATKVNKHPAQVLVRWSIQRGFIPLPRSSKAERIASNADVFGFELSKEDMEALNSRPQKPISWNPVDQE
ncbi:Aldo/keto reductase [Irpex rosettiformis]|uniref:Aldo/keto reductase n=1 Tax=Irpex rosettiformis TaxID=378272 RepID=A0ACB8U3N4_9APHY|nr:Aldo/keto reductase [Irpex rosettiformis]